MENVFGCDFDFSKRFEEEEEKEDEEHAIIETEAAVEAMMTKTTTRSVRSTVGDDVLLYGEDFKYLQTRKRREKNFFDSYGRKSAKAKWSFLNLNQSLLVLVVSGWTVVWFT